MTEPISPAAATIAAATSAVPALTALGINLGLRPDVLVAGFAGALVAIVLLGSVPSEGDTWRHLVNTTVRRIAVALASSLTAGYITPLVLLMSNVPDPLLMGGAFAVGAGAQTFLRGVIDRMRPAPPTQPAQNGGPNA